MRPAQDIRRAVIPWVLGLCGLIPAAPAQPAAAVKVLSHRPGLTFTRFVDPRENAFSTEVPKGWKTSGGLFRFASVDTRGAVESTSPAGDIRVSAGDADLPPFTIPNQVLAMAGLREGSWYSPGYGVRMMVRQYQSGVVFAEELCALQTSSSDRMLWCFHNGPGVAAGFDAVPQRPVCPVRSTGDERARRRRRGLVFLHPKRPAVEGVLLDHHADQFKLRRRRLARRARAGLCGCRRPGGDGASRDVALGRLDAIESGVGEDAAGRDHGDIGNRQPRPTNRFPPPFARLSKTNGKPRIRSSGGMRTRGVGSPTCSIRIRANPGRLKTGAAITGANPDRT